MPGTPKSDVGDPQPATPVAPLPGAPVTPVEAFPAAGAPATLPAAAPATPVGDEVPPAVRRQIP
eukprot:7539780-Alexandrium_andersonii.AAC.1